MIAFRKRNEVLREVKFYTDKDIAWYGPDGGPQDWAYENRSLAAMIHGKDPLYLMFHAGFAEQRFLLPPAPGGRTWRCAVDTSRAAPRDVWPRGTGRAAPAPGRLHPEDALDGDTDRHDSGARVP